MESVLFRIDERLIHGQVMVAWQAKTGANTVVIVDEAAAHDAFMQQVYQLAAPRNIKVLVAENEQFRQMLQEQDGQKAIILFKGPTEAWEALHEGVVPGELIVGNIATTPQRTKYTKYAYMSDAEKDKLADLQTRGWKVNMQLLPDDSKSEFKR